ncbi:RHS repeat-associated core domain-containing protein [Marinobacter sp. 1Y8]
MKEFSKACYRLGLRTKNVAKGLDFCLAPRLPSKLDWLQYRLGQFPEDDAHGNRTRQDEENRRGLEVTTYAYDNLDRLTEVTYPDIPLGTGTSVLTTYDAAYNRTGETTLNIEATTIADTTYHYNDRNQLTALDDNVNPVQGIIYTFDANGNQTAKTKAGTTTRFVYDVRDNLRSVTTGGSTVGQFLYDYRGLRIEKDGARGIERYSYDDQSVLTQFDASGATLAKFEYGDQRLISLNSLDNGLQYYHFDALGSPVTLTKPDGTVQARYSYDAWGHRRYQNGSSWNRFAFTGHEEDRETGLIYAKARYYDPDTGRFLSQDPWEGDTTIAPSLNKYLYAYGNPLYYIDPDGRCNRAGTNELATGPSMCALEGSFWGGLWQFGKQVASGDTLARDPSESSSSAVLPILGGIDTRRTPQEDADYNAALDNPLVKGASIIAGIRSGRALLKDGPDLLRSVSVRKNQEVKITDESSGSFEADVRELKETGKCSAVYCGGQREPDVGQGVDLDVRYSRNQNRHQEEDVVEQGFGQGDGLSRRTSDEVRQNIELNRTTGRAQSDKYAREYREANQSSFKPGDHACHRADQCAGGDSSDILGPGNGRVNSSLGVQNRNQQSGILEQVSEVEDQNRLLKVRITIEDNIK